MRPSKWRSGRHASFDVLRVFIRWSSREVDAPVSGDDVYVQGKGKPLPLLGGSKS